MGRKWTTGGWGVGAVYLPPCGHARACTQAPDLDDIGDVSDYPTIPALNGRLAPQPPAHHQPPGSRSSSRSSSPVHWAIGPMQPSAATAAAPTPGSPHRTVDGSGPPPRPAAGGPAATAAPPAHPSNVASHARGGRAMALEPAGPPPHVGGSAQHVYARGYQGGAAAGGPALRRTPAAGADGHGPHGGGPGGHGVAWAPMPPSAFRSSLLPPHEEEPSANGGDGTAGGGAARRGSGSGDMDGGGGGGLHGRSQSHAGGRCAATRWGVGAAAARKDGMGAPPRRARILYVVGVCHDACVYPVHRGREVVTALPQRSRVVHMDTGYRVQGGTQGAGRYLPGGFPATARTYPVIIVGVRISWACGRYGTATTHTCVVHGWIQAVGSGWIQGTGCRDPGCRVKPEGYTTREVKPRLRAPRAARLAAEAAHRPRSVPRWRPNLQRPPPPSLPTANRQPQTSAPRWQP